MAQHFLCVRPPVPPTIAVLHNQYIVTHRTLALLKTLDAGTVLLGFHLSLHFFYMH
jgi:hypothetical protein